MLVVIVVIVTIVTSGVRLLRDARFYGDCPQQMKLSRFALWIHIYYGSTGLRAAGKAALSYLTYRVMYGVS